MPLFGLARPLVLLGTKTQLNRDITVGLHVLDLKHGAWPRLHDRHGNRRASLIEDPGHADFSSNYSSHHTVLFANRP